MLLHYGHLSLVQVGVIVLMLAATSEPLYGTISFDTQKPNKHIYNRDSKNTMCLMPFFLCCGHCFSLVTVYIVLKKRNCLKHLYYHQVKDRKPIPFANVILLPACSNTPQL